MPDKIQQLNTESPDIQQSNEVDHIDKKEQEQAVEKTTEQSQEQAVEKTTEQKGEQLQKRPLSIKKKPTAIPQVRDELTLEIEKIMSDGVGEEFEKLSPVAQQEFKLKGEQTAIAIRELMKSTKIKVKKILKLILEWLRILPGINRFFLEQEAKIKTDRIIQLKEDQ